MKKGHSTRTHNYKCKYCGKGFKKFFSSTKDGYSPKYCSMVCRRYGMNPARPFTDEIIRRYQQEEQSVNRIKSDLKLGKAAVKTVLLDAGFTIRNMGFYQIGEKNPRYKNGRTIENGYVKITIGGGKRQFEHRLILEKTLKRKLSRHEQVHHLNGQRADNRPENLALYSPRLHGHLHAREFNNLKKMYCSRIAVLESRLAQCVCHRTADL